jgi:DNA-binding CsgD family transcriptional regulator
VDREAGGAGRLIALRAALGALRDARVLPQVTRKAVVNACRGCGFERAVLISIQGPDVTVESAHSEHDPEWGEEFLRRAQEETIVLDTGSLEAEVVRRMEPISISETDSDRLLIGDLLEPRGRASTLAVPIMPEGRVVAILCADCSVSGRVLEPLDRELLCTFAEALAFVLERAVLRERLALQHGNVSSFMNAVGEVMSHLNGAQIDLVPPESQLTPPQPASDQSWSSYILPEARLTSREKEVLSLLAAGKNNSGIASRLVVSESTVKSHVKHILRKLGAKNRAEAVSRFLRSEGDLEPDSDRAPGSARLRQPSGSGE